MFSILVLSTAWTLPSISPTSQVLHGSKSRMPARIAMMASTTSEEIIPRDVLFGNPEYASPSISPDGKYIAYVRPDEEILNVYVRTVGKADDRVVTKDRYRGIRQFFWAEDSTTLLFMQDDGGDENFHLFAINAVTPSATARDLTPFKGAKAQNLITNKRFQS